MPHKPHAKPGIMGIVYAFEQGDWNRFAFLVQPSYGISMEEWSDQHLVDL